MKYRFIIIIIVSLFLIGCKKEDNINILECSIGSTVITLSVENGKIIKYVDKIQGEFEQKEIDVLNETYLKSIDNNKEALLKLREVIATNGGDCK